MKVGDLGGAGAAPDLPESKRKVRERGSVGASKGVASSKAEDATPFAKAFLDASAAAAGRALDQIMEELGRQGERLAGTQNFDELGKYKALVQEFIRKATQGTVALRFTDGNSRGQSGKVHVILQKVDQQLEALTREVLARQATPLALLSRLDQIRGLLLDLYK